MYGSEKQISWAKDIKAKFAENFSEEMSRNAEKIQSAKFWIDHRFDKADHLAAVIEAIASMTVFSDKKADSIRCDVIDTIRTSDEFCRQDCEARWIKNINIVRQIDDEKWWLEHEQYANNVSVFMSHAYACVKQKGE